MNKKIVLLVTILCIALLAGTGHVFAASSDKTPWTVENIGTFNVPVQWQAVEFNDIFELIKADAERRGGQKAFPPNMPDITALLKAANIHMYQISINDGKAYHTAALMVVKDNKPIPDDLRQFFDNKLTPEQRDKIEKMDTEIQSMLLQELKEDPTTKIGLKSLEMGPLETFKIGRKQAYGQSLRVVPSIYGIVVPFYAKGYVFSIQDSLAFVGLICDDADHAFWEPIIQKMVRSYR